MDPGLAWACLWAQLSHCLLSGLSSDSTVISLGVQLCWLEKTILLGLLAIHTPHRVRRVRRPSAEQAVSP